MWCYFWGFCWRTSWYTETDLAFFCSRNAAFNQNIWSIDFTVANVTAFDSDFFAVLANFEDTFVEFYTLMVTCLTCSGDGVHEVVRIPWTEGGYATFGLSTLVLQTSHSPTFNWTLETFADCNACDVDILSIFEDFFWCYGFTKKLFSVFELLLDCSSADLDFTCFRFLP